MSRFVLQSIPVELEWKNNPLSWNLESGDSISIIAGDKTDWFVDPARNGWDIDSAPCALFVPSDKNFTLSAKVKVNFASTFDAGVLQLRENDKLWAKLCFEYSPQNNPTIVSVVTRDVSDDCNSVIINGNEVYLRIAVMSEVIGFHYSLDGNYWNLVRYFTLGKLDNLRVGLSSQSPTGKQCRSVFSNIKYKSMLLKDFRNGE